MEGSTRVNSVPLYYRCFLYIYWTGPEYSWLTVRKGLHSHQTIKLGSVQEFSLVRLVNFYPIIFCIKVERISNFIWKALNGFYSDLPTRCIKSTQRALLSQIADITCSIEYHFHLRCCLYNQRGLQDLRWKDGQPTWRNPFRAFALPFLWFSCVIWENISQGAIPWSGQSAFGSVNTDTQMEMHRSANESLQCNSLIWSIRIWFRWH